MCHYSGRKQPREVNTTTKRNSRNTRKWEPTVRKRKLPSERITYQVDLGKVDGARIRRNFQTRKEADLFAESAKEDRKLGTLDPRQLSSDQVSVALDAYDQIPGRQPPDLLAAAQALSLLGDLSAQELVDAAQIYVANMPERRSVNVRTAYEHWQTSWKHHELAVV